jgi:hypothetical protein
MDVNDRVEKLIEIVANQSSTLDDILESLDKMDKRMKIIEG